MLINGHPNLIIPESLGSWSPGTRICLEEKKKKTPKVNRMCV